VAYPRDPLLPSAASTVSGDWGGGIDIGIRIGDIVCDGPFHGSR